MIIVDLSEIHVDLLAAPNGNLLSQSPMKEKCVDLLYVDLSMIIVDL